MERGKDFLAERDAKRHSLSRAEMVLNMPSSYAGMERDSSLKTWQLGITATGVKENVWDLFAVGAIGMLQNAGLHWRFVKKFYDRRVMEALERVDEDYSGVGASMVKTLFPGELRLTDKDYWDAKREEREKEQRKREEQNERAKRATSTGGPTSDNGAGARDTATATDTVLTQGT